MDRKPVLIAFGWSTDRRSPISTGIRYLTRRGFNPFTGWASWSHMFLVFRFADGDQEIHEALMDEGWKAKSIRKLLKWNREDLENHRFIIHWLPLDAEDIEAIYQRSCSWLGTKSYAHRQIGAIALTETFLGRAVTKLTGYRIRMGEEEVICSEGAGMLVGERCPEWDLRRGKDQPWDMLYPQPAHDRLMDLFNGNNREPTGCHADEVSVSGWAPAFA